MAPSSAVSATHSKDFKYQSLLLDFTALHKCISILSIYSELHSELHTIFFIPFSLIELICFPPRNSVDHWGQLCLVGFPESCRDHGKPPQRAGRQCLLVWLWWTAVERPSPSSLPSQCEEEQHRVSSSSTVVATTWGGCVLNVFNITV